MAEVFSVATVLAVHPASYTCDVRKLHSGTDLLRVPVLGSTGGVFSNGMSWMHDLRGAVVVLIEVMGRPYVLSTLPVQVSPNISTVDRKSTSDVPENKNYNSEVSLTNTGSGAENSQSYGGDAGGYAGGRQTGFLPGDRVITADGGAQLGLFSGGLAMLKASPLAQVILGALQDFVRVVARKFELITDFGTLTFTDGSSGRSGMAIEGGASTAKENKPGETTPTVRFYLGDVPQAPDKRMVLEARSTDESQYGVLAYGVDGNMVQATSGNYLLTAGKNRDVRVFGGNYTEVDGVNEESIGGNDTKTVTGSLAQTVSGKGTESFGGNYDMSTGGSATMSASGNFEISAGGTVNVFGKSINFKATRGASSGAQCVMTVSSLNIVKA